MAQPSVAPPGLDQHSTNPTSNDGSRLAAFAENGSDEARAGVECEASPSRGDSDVDPSHDHVQVKDESDTDGELEAESEDGGLRAFESKESLLEARVEHRTLQDLMDLLQKEAVDLNPEYQREVVWDRSRMMGLIDSIIENYYIPPVIFNRQITRDKEGSACIKRICVDGKQRLSAVRSFIEGKIGCHDRCGGVWYYTAVSANETRTHRRTLPEHVKEQFRNRKFICYEYPNLKKTQEEDLFSRVQKGVQLTAAEKTRATTGPWQEFAKIYERDFPKVVELSATKRSAGFQNVLMSFAQILEAYRCIAIEVAPEMRTQAMAIKKLLKNTEDYNPYFRDIIRQTFVKFKGLVEMDPQTFRDNNYTHAKRFSPFEFVATAVLISLLREQQDDQELLASIRGMRLTLRRYLKDLRMNRDSWIVSWNYIAPLVNERFQVSTADDRAPMNSQTVQSVLTTRLSHADHPIPRPVAPRSARPPQFSHRSITSPYVSPGVDLYGPGDRPILTAQLESYHGLQSMPAVQKRPASTSNIPGSPSHITRLHIPGPSMNRAIGHSSDSTGAQGTSNTDHRDSANIFRLELKSLQMNNKRELQRQQPGENPAEDTNNAKRKDHIAPACGVQTESGRIMSSASEKFQQVEGLQQSDHAEAKLTASMPSQQAAPLELGNQPESTGTQVQLEANTARASNERTTTSMKVGMGIRKKHLARFTSSGYNSQGDVSAPRRESTRSSAVETARNGSAVAASPQDAMLSEPELLPKQQQQLSRQKRRGELVIEISEDEASEAAEELLAIFKPHTSKRTKVKKEDTSEV